MTNIKTRHRREAHRIARQLGHQSVILIGHADYYPRFGYSVADNFGISFSFEIPKENAMVLELVPESLKDIKGKVGYPEAFGLGRILLV